MGRLVDVDALKSIIQQEPTDGMYTHEILAVIDEQPTIEPYGTWIPCSERLPYYAYWRDVCVTMKMYDTFVTRKVNWNGEEGRWEWGNGKLVKEQVIAWMPLPEPYREEENDE